jgi:hypothetical protein
MYPFTRWYLRTKVSLGYLWDSVWPTRRPRLARIFDQRFKPLGGGLEFRTAYHDGIQVLGQSLVAERIPNSDIYCDLIFSSRINAYVTEVDSVYLIGITDGVIRKVSDLILRY